MAKYRCKRQFLLTVKPKDGGRPMVTLHQPGDEIEYDGLPSANLEPLDASAKKRVKEAEEIFAQQKREGALKQATGGMEILAALTEALHRVQSTGAAPTYNPAEGPKIETSSPAKFGR